MTWLGKWTVTWGLLGTLALLLQGLRKVGLVALELLSGPPVPLPYWLIGLGWIAFMAYTEGYRGFQRAFSPRTVVRAWAIGRAPTWTRALLAPAICMGLWEATPRRLKISWGVLLAVVGAVLAIRALPYPARSLADLGVFVGLSWGAASLVYFWARALGGQLPDVPSDLPQG